MSIARDLLCFTVSLTIPFVVVLSAMMGVSNWGWFSSWRAIWNSSYFLVLVYNALISASVADAMTFQRILQTKCMGPFGGMTDSSDLIRLLGQSLRKRCPPALLMASGCVAHQFKSWTIAVAALLMGCSCLVAMALRAMSI
eukprot:6231127-Ditylum_brightwellii.AAC.1